MISKPSYFVTIIKSVSVNFLKIIRVIVSYNFVLTIVIRNDPVVRASLSVNVCRFPEQSLVAETGAFVEAVCTGNVNDERDNEKWLRQRNGREARGAKLHGTVSWVRRKRGERLHGKRMSRRGRRWHTEGHRGETEGSRYLCVWAVPGLEFQRTGG